MFNEPNPFLSQHRNISIFKDLQILNALKDIKVTYNTVADIFAVSNTYVINLFDTMVDIKRH